MLDPTPCTFSAGTKVGGARQSDCDLGGIGVAGL